VWWHWPKAAALTLLINHSSSWPPSLHSITSTSLSPFLSETPADEEPTQKEELLDDYEDEEDEDEYHYVYEDEEADKEDEYEKKESSKMSESQDEDLQEVKGL